MTNYWLRHEPGVLLTITYQETAQVLQHQTQSQNLYRDVNKASSKVSKQVAVVIKQNEVRSIVAVMNVHAHVSIQVTGIYARKTDNKLHPRSSQAVVRIALASYHRCKKPQIHEQCMSDHYHRMTTHVHYTSTRRRRMSSHRR